MRNLNNIGVTGLAGILAFAFYVQPGSAKAEQHIACPTSVDARQVQVDSPSGWTGVFGPEGKLPLVDVQAIFVVGSLRDSAWGELKDPPTTRKGKSVMTTYPLPPETDKYVICSYGDRIYQAKKLPPTTKQCDVLYRPEETGAKGKNAKYVIADVICG